MCTILSRASRRFFFCFRVFFITKTHLSKDASRRLPNCALHSLISTYYKQFLWFFWFFLSYYCWRFKLSSVYCLQHRVYRHEGVYSGAKEDETAGGCKTCFTTCFMGAASNVSFHYRLPCVWTLPLPPAHAAQTARFRGSPRLNRVTQGKHEKTWKKKQWNKQKKSLPHSHTLFSSSRFVMASLFLFSKQ